MIPQPIIGTLTAVTLLLGDVILSNSGWTVAGQEVYWCKVLVPPSLGLCNHKAETSKTIAVLLIQSLQNMICTIPTSVV